ncbi:MAG: hypothetical protein ACYTAO_20645 [Planctomycetota bacterium]
MNRPDIGQVEQRLTAVIAKERRESIGYHAGQNNQGYRRTF